MRLQKTTKKTTKKKTTKKTSIDWYMWVRVKYCVYQLLELF